MAKKEPRFYWLKFLVRFFREDGPVDYMLSLPNGSEYVVLYLKLWTLTINTEQYLVTKYGNLEVPYDLAKIQRDAKFFSYDTVRTAMELYRQLDLIKLNSEGLWQLRCDDIQVGSTCASAARVADKRMRDKNKALQCNTDVTTEIRDDRDKRDRDTSSIDDDNITSLIDLYNSLKLVKERKNVKLKNKIKDALTIISISDAEAVITYAAKRYHNGEYTEGFVPRLGWLMGDGLNETLTKMKKNKNQFSNFSQKQDYDIDNIEKELLAN